MTTATMHTILGQEFELDELREIANYGMEQGVSGFIYTKDCVDKFNEFDDEIEEYLSDYYFDTMNERNYMAAICTAIEPGSIDELKNKMVWMYVELNAQDILTQIDPNY